LTPDTRRAIGLVTGCGYIDSEIRTLQLEPGSWLEITGVGIVLDRPSGRVSRLAPQCGGKIAHVRKPVLDEVAAAESELHLAEIFRWKTRSIGSDRLRVLTWELLEIVGSSSESLATVDVMEEVGSLWPTPKIPDKYLSGARLSVISPGVIHWTFSDDHGPEGTVRLEIKAIK
jgi:hypothetical protein